MRGRGVVLLCAGWGYSSWVVLLCAGVVLLRPGWGTPEIGPRARVQCYNGRRRMVKKLKSLSIVSTPGQKFACRDCPARCCTAPWGYPVTPEERQRILGDEEARERMGPRGRAILEAGVLPTRERGNRLACVFLDDDLLCSLHKRHGHEFLPAPCQAFPFGFSENESGAPIALTSRYCPSIRENYGEPIEPILVEKYRQAGGAAPLARKMGLRSGRVLDQSQFVRVVEAWREALREPVASPLVLARLFEFTEAVDRALPKSKNPDDADFEKILSSAREVSVPPLARRTLGFSGRILLSHLLGSLCLPARQMLAHRLTPIRRSERWGAWWMRLRWLFRWGRVELLFIERPVRVAAIDRVASVFQGEEGALVSDYLVEVLGRRQGMTRQTYLHRVLVDLALMTSLISRYARASAAARDQTRVIRSDVQEAIGIAELLFTHQGEAGQGRVLQQLRLKLMSDQDDFRRLLAAEI